MRINFNLNYSQIKFRGINDTIERIKNDIKRGETGTDSFESSNGEQTIIIENYYEKNGDNSPNNENFKSLNNENKSNYNQNTRQVYARYKRVVEKEK